MQDNPRAEDLLEAIQDLLMKEVLPAVRDNDALSYKTLVSWNMLGVVARELRSGEKSLNEERRRLARLLGQEELSGAETYADKLKSTTVMNERLASMIRENKLDPTGDRQVVDHVMETLREKLQVSNPRFQVEPRD